MNVKQKYQSFCEEECLPVFVQDWYLDVTCGKKNWDVAIVEKGQDILGVLPYYKVKKGPFHIITMPWLVKMMGPFLSIRLRKVEKKRQIMKALIAQLPAVAAFQQNFYYPIDDWMPFYWEGFRQNTAYSYVISDLQNLEKVYKNISKSYRNNKIKKASEIVHFSEKGNIADFYTLMKMTFERQHKKLSIPFSFIKNFDEVLQTKNAGKKFFAIDDAGSIHAAAYLIWDTRCAYLLMSGNHPDLRKSGAGIFLCWQMIKYSSEVLACSHFDFLGSMLPSVERVNRSFGAEASPYFIVGKESSRLYCFLKNLTFWY